MTPMLYAQDTPYPFSKFEDRKEGIVKPRKLVGGEKIRLMSASIRSGEGAPATDDSSYRLEFCLTAPKRVRVLVQSFEKNYLMEPLNRNYVAGTARFRWPDTIPSFFDLAPKDLHPFVAWYESAEQHVAPVWVFQGTPKLNAWAYEFDYALNKPALTLSYTLFDVDTLVPIVEGELENLAAEQLFSVRWDGRNVDGSPANEGYYKLLVTAVFKNVAGRRYEVSHPVTFYHCFDQ